MCGDVHDWQSFMPLLSMLFFSALLLIYCYLQCVTMTSLKATIQNLYNCWYITVSLKAASDRQPGNVYIYIGTSQLIDVFKNSYS